MIAALSGLAVAFLVQFAGCTTTPDDASELYYAFMDDDRVKVEFFKAFHIDKDMCCDVTIISTDDSCTWNTIMDKANVKDEFRDKFWISREKGIKSVSFSINRKDYDYSSKGQKAYYCDLNVFNTAETKLYSFAVMTEEQFDHLFDYASNNTYKGKQIISNN